jgi:hypothetical protein
MNHAQGDGGVQFSQYLDIYGESKYNIATSFLNDCSTFLLAWSRSEIFMSLSQEVMTHSFT